MAQAPLQGTPETYTRLDIVVRNDGRDPFELWEQLDAVLCPQHSNHDNDDEACSIEAGFATSGTLEELKADNAKMENWT